MRLTSLHPHRPFQLVATLVFVALALSAASAADVDRDQTVRLEEFEVHESKASTQLQAPTDSNLTARQPQSVINLQSISNDVAPTADCATIANIAPSVTNLETNGPVLSEAKNTTIRGSDDGGYNVTFDGLPFGDYNSFTLPHDQLLSR